MGRSWWVADAYAHSPVMLVSWIVLVIGSIVLHELAHGWVAIRCGDDVPLHSGHMTANPFVHIPPFAWLMFALVGITWGLMPTNPYNYRGRYDVAKVSLAGPAMNLLLAIVACISAVAWVKFGPNQRQPLFDNMLSFLSLALELNLVLMLFNLVPVPPLDGSRALANFVPSYGRLWDSETGQVIALVAFAGLFYFSGGLVWGVAEHIASVMIAAAASVL